MILTINIIGWIACGIVAAGMLFAYTQAKFKLMAKEYYRVDLGMSILLGLMGGPCTLFVAFFSTEFCKHGWRLK